MMIEKYYITSKMPNFNFIDKIKGSLGFKTPEISTPEVSKDLFSGLKSG